MAGKGGAKPHTMHHNTIAAIALLVLTVLVIVAIGAEALKVRVPPGSHVQELFMMIIAGLVALIGIIAIIATVFNLLDLSDQTQAMALPEGSIRAIIALALLLLFSILSVFLYNGLQNPPTGSMHGLSKAEAIAFVQKNASLPNLKMDIEAAAPAVGTSGPPGPPPPGGRGSRKGSNPPASSPASTASAGSTAAVPVAAAATTGAAPANASQTYSVTWGGDTASSDFAKQLMTLLGTLVTSVVSFYFGARTANSSAAAATKSGKQSKGPDGGSMTLSKASSKVSEDGRTANVTILGANLNSVVHVILRRAGSDDVVLDGVQSNAGRVTGTAKLDGPMEGPPPWDVMVDDGAGKSAALPGGLQF